LSLRRSALLVLLGSLLGVLSASESARPLSSAVHLPQPRYVLDTGAVQPIYAGGVPHTDAQGALRSRYGSGSFFPRCLYHAVPGSFSTIRRAGFNCVHVWEGVRLGQVIGELRSAGLQVIPHAPTHQEVVEFASDPHILGWYLDEEPTGHAYLDMARTGAPGLIAERYRVFLANMAAIKAVDPRHPVFPLDGTYAPPGLGAWWDRWNTAGDVSAHDNYPLQPGTTSLEALARSVSRAAALNGGRKPLWITLQAFGSLPGLDADVRMPTPGELRGMAFTAIVHGATGLILFAWDSPVTRMGHVLGIGPATRERYDSGTAASPEDAARSRALWAGAVALNAELERLTPALLAPTARVPYQVWYAGESRTPSAIRTMLKQNTDGGYTMLAANLEGTPLAARYRFRGGIASVGRREPDGSVRALAHDASTFGDALHAFGAAVYEIRLEP
jgi:hypothetical protein